MSTPHLEPRPWLPAAHDLPFLGPYQMAHIVIGWPLLLPGATGGSFFGWPRRNSPADELEKLIRESTVEEVVMLMAASGDMEGLGVAAMRFSGSFGGAVGSPGVTTGVVAGKTVAGFRGVMKMAGSHRQTSPETEADIKGSALMKSVDHSRLNRLWRILDDAELAALDHD